MNDEPNFRALAALWLARDPRAQDLDESTREAIVTRLAEALKRRRQGTDHSHQDVGLIVNIDRDQFESGKGLAEEAIEQLTRFLQERIEEERNGS